MIDREALRVRLLDVLATFAPRHAWDHDRRVDYWTDRLMEADRPGEVGEVLTRGELESLLSVTRYSRGKRWATERLADAVLLLVKPDPEVEALRRRVAELEVALGLMDDAERDAEDELHEVERALHDRLQRDAHVVAVEAERDDLRRKVERVLALVEDSEREVAQYGPPRVRDYEDLVDMVPADVLREVVGDTPSTSVVDSE